MKMVFSNSKIIAIALSLIHTAYSHYDPNMDRTLFEIQWPGSDLNKELDTTGLHDDLNVVVMTKDNEKYKCVLPEKVISSLEDTLENYEGPNEFQLLEGLMDQTSCSYRIEAYWTYELCHGRHLRQYHEEKEMGKKPNLQEYYLGVFDRVAAKTAMQSKAAENKEETKSKSKVPTKRVEGVEVPFYEMTFKDGTVCDLTGEPRKAHIHYTCHLDGKGEIYEIKETASCEYEVVILTGLLCSHPNYMPPKEPVNYIQCHPFGEAPQKPKLLEEFEAENNKGKYNKRQLWGDLGGSTLEELLEDVLQGFGGKIKIDIDGAELEDDVDDEDAVYERVHSKTSSTFYQRDKKAVETKEGAAAPAPQEKVSLIHRKKDTLGKATDKSLLKDFLSGDFCIKGGTGWWKHEFCYGKKVIQYHEDNNGKTVIVLGQWDETAHKQWLDKNPQKMPKASPSRLSVSHYYGSGEICDLTQKPRFTEVKLKCKPNAAQPHAVAIYLVEPNPCEYIVVVESPILCELVRKADEYGLVPENIDL